MTSKLKTDILETVSGSGTIALTNQLSGMTSASVPAGSVVQMVANYHEATAHVATTSTSFVAMGSPYELSITPKFSNSLIVVEVQNGMAHPKANTGLMMMITKGGTPMQTPTYPNYNYSAIDHYLPVSIIASGVSGGTSAITYGVSFRVDGNGTSSRAIHTGGNYHIKITEIKQ